LGVKVVSQKTGKEYPKAVDYFVCPPVVQEVYGAEPRELRIMFPVEDPEIFFPQWYKRYGATTGLVCKGDGEKAIEIVNGYMKEIDCLGEKCPYVTGDEEKGIKKSCKKVGMLQFLLPDVPGAGVWQITTSSRNSIININSAIAYIGRGGLCGRIVMIPLTLKLGPQDVQHDGKKKTVYVLSIDMNIKLADLQKAALVEPTRVALPPPDEELPEHYEEVKVVENEEDEELSQSTEDPTATEETGEPSDEEKAEIHKQELLGMPAPKRLALIKLLINEKGYIPPANSKPPEKLSPENQVEYILFLGRLPQEVLPFK